MSSIDKRIDVDSIAKEVAKQIHGEFLSEMRLDESIETEVKKDVAELSEAYVPQVKSYSMTTDYVSEKTKITHEKLYKGYVEKLGKVSIEVDSADKENVSSAASQYRTAKRDEVFNMNAVYLHELYFSNCFDPNSELFYDALPYMKLASDWGTFDAWMADFMACGLSSRSGWVVCGYSLYLKRYVNVFTDGHDGGVLFGIVPLVVIDMNEHAYVGDYGNNVKKYLTAMMRELDWTVVEDRANRIESIKKVLG